MGRLSISVFQAKKGFWEDHCFYWLRPWQLASEMLWCHSESEMRPRSLLQILVEV